LVKLDHLLWAAPDLEEGEQLFAMMSGVRPARGGTHPGFGTRNSLVSLGPGTYFEIISPDPLQDLTNTRGSRIAAQSRPGMMTFAIRTTDSDRLLAAAKSVGLVTTGPLVMSRTRSDGVKLAWSVLYFGQEELGDAVPFAIDWGNSPHPSLSTPTGCSLADFRAIHPNPGRLRDIYAELGIAVPIEPGSAPSFRAALKTPNGEIIFGGP
jgi:hypothetical protein